MQSTRRDLRYRDRAPHTERTRTRGHLALVAISENLDRRLFLFIPDDVRVSRFSYDGRCVANCVCVRRRLSVSGTTRSRRLPIGGGWRRS